MADKDIRKLQVKELEILNAFIKVCEDNNLQYYAVGGTLLGAVRHRGFIPWDDDMDLAMPRKDYDLFVNKYYEQLPENIKPYDFHFVDSDVYFYPLKLENIDVKVKEQRLSDTDKISYLSIDIFPIDNYPDNKVRRGIYKINFYKYKALIGFCNIDILRKNVNRGCAEKMAIAIGKKFRIGDHLDLKQLQYRYDAFLRKNSREKSSLEGDITGAYGFREFVPREYFGNGKYLEFEGIKIHVPSEYDKYLTHIYGDYMTLPPESERHAGHLEIVNE